MPPLAPEIGLLHALALNAVVFVCAWRLSCRVSRDAAQRAGDALLLFFGVQYAAIALPGVMGELNLWTLSGVALTLSAVNILLARALPRLSAPQSPGEGPDRLALPAGLLFVMGVLACLIWMGRHAPATATDALVYHLPAAVQWMRTGRLGLYPVWYFNPANTWSPLAGSTFVAWLMAPVHGDVLARFVQAPPLLLVFLALVRIGRSLGARAWVAVIVAAAAVCSRPFISEAMLCKDDLFLAAFLAVAFAGCAPERLADRGGALRVGIGLGLALATKYTALLALPVCVLLIDAPFRAGWRWRQWVVAGGAVLLLAGPWYVRNWILTGNPLYPVEIRFAGHRIFAGLFAAQRSLKLRTGHDIWGVLTHGYFGIPAPVLGLLAVAWLAVLARRCGAVLRQPMMRLGVLGPPLGVAIFIALAPYAEVRFLLPALLLLFACAAAGIAAWLGDSWAGAMVAVLLLMVAAGTAYAATDTVLKFVAAGAVTAGAGLGWMALRQRHPRVREYEWAGVVVALALLGLGIYVDWKGYVRQCSVDADAAWRQPGVYGAQAEVWQFVRSKLPAGTELAYANTFLVYPLLGEEQENQAEYVPTRHGLESFEDLPRFERPVAGEGVGEEMTRVMEGQPDQEEWIRRLEGSKAQYLMVMKKGPSNAPPEWEFIRREPERFQSVFENDGGVVYQIRW